MRVGVDVGGTYTDLVLLADGELLTHKIPSTPDDPGQAVLRAVTELKIPLREVSVFAHGTTVATNAVIQRAGARTGLLTTHGFRDVLQIRRTTRGALYDFQWDPPEELVPRELRREVDERTLASGDVLREANLEQARAEVAALVEAGIASLAICFINSYVNPENELRVRDAVSAAFPDLPVFVSSELLPEWREFERTSTTVVSAYIGPVLGEYVRGLADTLGEQGYGSDLMIMSSNGGLATADACLASPATTLLSGPAAGVIAQLALLRHVGIEDAIGMDIGGTSTDISIIHEGQPHLRSEYEIEFGTTVSSPVIDINAIGAGGGTIAWLDRGGMLHAGPQSAGAIPGPACLERGGLEPTLTDANVVLHRLNPHQLLGGRVAISEQAARQAIAQVSEALGLEIEPAAAGIVTLAVSNIVLAIRQLTVERGLDPRQFTLIAYGGAGPSHAAAVAEQLGLTRVLIPRFPGLTSALGLQFSDIRHDFVQTFLRDAHDCDPTELAIAFERLASRGLERLASEGLAPERISTVRSADLRYAGQTHELNVMLPPDPSEAYRQLGDRLHTAHLKEFGHAPEPDAALEIVAVRVACIGVLERPTLPRVEALAEAEPIGEREVVFDGVWRRTPVYNRAHLGHGARPTGPVVIEQTDSTTLVPSGWSIEVDSIGNVRLTAE
jgi:N-methylhydantoinase A